MSREHDIVVYGATGFVGGLVCRYLARRAPDASTRWAIAGRNADKLQHLRETLAREHGELARLPMLVADSGDPESLARMAESTQVVLTTVGPYARYGSPLVEACVRAGIRYVDLTGEPLWWKEMIDRHHDAARASGAKIVPACGFDSVPFDMGAFVTARALPAEAPKRIRGYFAARAGVSGGTWRSALGILGGIRPTRRGTDAAGGLAPRGIHRAPDVGAWVFPLPTIDPMVVRRSSRLCDGYGPDFAYQHYMQLGGPVAAVTVASGFALLSRVARSQIMRTALGRLIPAGTGPGEERRARSWFRAKFVGEGGGERVVTVMRGGDPGYGETAKMIVESALCLAHDALESDAGGVLTTASAMGTALVERLARAGLPVEILESGPA